MSIELFPIDIGYYDNHGELGVAGEVEKIASLLAELGVADIERPWWGTDMCDRGGDAVEVRLRDIRTKNRGPVILYWAGHGWENGESATLGHARSPHPIGLQGVSPETLAEAIQQWLSPDDEEKWLWVIIDACSSAAFVDKAVARLSYLLRETRPRVAFLATSRSAGITLGRLSIELRDCLDSTFRLDESIRVRRLARELDSKLGGAFWPLYLPDEAVLTRVSPPLVSYAGPLDMRDELEQLRRELKLLLQELPEHERGHFIPKAQGGELAHEPLVEAAWYFTGRDRERREVMRGLEAGSLTVVTGRAGAGKSALLGDILVRSRPALADFLTQRELLAHIPDAPPPPFDAAVHLSGMSNEQVLAQLCEALALPFSAATALEEQVVAIETAGATDPVPKRLLVDALDEAVDPMWAAGVIRRLAQLPAMSLLVGTRRSTKEGPDQPDTPDSTLLDALGPATVITVERDPAAAYRYALARLKNAQSADVLPEDIEWASRCIAELNQEFLYVRLATYELLRRPDLIRRIDVVAELGDTHRALFANAVSRLSDQNPLYYPLLAALAMAQGRGLPILDRVWATIAQAIHGNRRPITDFDAAITQLINDAAKPYLAVDHEYDQTVYRLAHRTFVEHFLRDREQCRVWHQAIVEAAIASIERDADAH